MKITISGALTFRQVLGKNQPLTIEADRCSLEEVLHLLSERPGGPFNRLVFEQQTGK